MARRVILVAALLILTTGCGTPSASKAASSTVSVLYASSLTRLMESEIGPGFAQATGAHFFGEDGGSTALARFLQSGAKTADAFISASPSAIRLLMTPKGLVRWYFLIARSALVLAFNPQGPHAAAFVAAQGGKTPWYAPLLIPGVRLGRTDPRLDPKGVRTLYLFQLTAKVTHHPNLEQAILGRVENPAQVFPETALVGDLMTGQIDAAVLYKSEAVQAHLPYLSLPAAVNLSDPAEDAFYAQAVYRDAKGGVEHGSAIVFAVTIPRNAPHPGAAVRFVQYLLSPAGRLAFQQAGLTPIRPVLVGSRLAVPTALRPLATPPVP